MKKTWGNYDMPSSIKGMSAEDILNNIKKRSFHKLNETDVENVSCGWIDIFENTDTENFNNSRCGEYLVFGVRLDEYRFSSKEMKPVVDEYKHNFKQGNNKKTLSTDEVKALKESAFRGLKTKSLPKTDYFELVFDFSAEKIYTNTISKKFNEKIQELFKNTFYTELEKQESDVDGTSFIHYVFEQEQHRDDILFGENIKIQEPGSEATFKKCKISDVTNRYKDFEIIDFEIVMVNKSSSFIFNFNQNLEMKNVELPVDLKEEDPDYKAYEVDLMKELNTMTNKLIEEFKEA